MIAPWVAQVLGQETTQLQQLKKFVEEVDATEVRQTPVLLTLQIFSGREDSHAAIGVSCRTVDRSAVRMAVMVLRPAAVS